MITTPTVVVLGAGASKPYGLPTAIDLRQELIKLKSRGQTKIEVAHQLGTRKEFVDQFLTSFQKSQMKSVDAFIEQRPEYAAIGKALIAYCLLSKETEGKLWTTRDWLEELFSLMDAGARLDDFSNNQIVFITFNYDRLLELALYTHLVNGFGAGHDQAKRIVESFSILHAYGDLGQPFSPSTDYVEYGIDPGTIDLSRAASRIHLVGDELDNFNTFKSARDHLSAADRVIFIGFGFHPLNLKRITKLGRKVGSRWLACGYGMTEGEIRIAQKRSPQGQHPDEDGYREEKVGAYGMVARMPKLDYLQDPYLEAYQSILFGKTDHDATRFLREYADFFLEEV